VLVAVVVVTCGLTARLGIPVARAETSNASASGAPASDWALPGHDYDNTRATTASPITTSNVANLQVAWKATLGGPLSTVPIVVGDTVYVQDGSGRVTALNRASGTARWHADAGGFNIGPFGVAVADGRVFALHGSTGVVALDAETGATLWTTDVTRTATEGVDIQPVAFEGRVYVATVPVSIRGIYKGGDRGTIYALDAKTGRQVWSFDTVKSPSLWGDAEVNSGGGAWYPPAIDPRRHLMYWGTANPAPFPGTKEQPNGSSRPGANLYTDSIVVLDSRTGKLRWYHQVQPHDLFDRDQVHTMLTTTADGTRVAISAGKGGYVLGLDPVTGRLRWKTAVGLHQNDQLRRLTGPTTIEPGTYGGVETPPANAGGTVYAAVVNAPITLQPDALSYFGAKFGQQPGEVDAVDASSGKVLWSTKVPGDPLGGAAVVNDVVLTTLFQGQLVALDRASGRIVSQKKLDGGSNGWLAVAGDLVLVPVGNANPPELVAYRLG
jgi:outer membrane protein assembly factor BamB